MEGGLQVYYLWGLGLAAPPLGQWDLEDYIPLDRYPGCFCQIKWQVEGMCREKAEGTRELVYCEQGIIDLGYKERSEREGL